MRCPVLLDEVAEGIQAFVQRRHADMLGTTRQLREFLARVGGRRCRTVERRMPGLQCRQVHPARLVQPFELTLALAMFRRNSHVRPSVCQP